MYHRRLSEGDYDDGLITKYLLLEDSWHIADAVRP